MGDAIFSPSPLMIENVGLHVLGRACWAATACSCSGPRCCWRRTCRWRRFVGETVGNQADVIYAGGGFNAYLFPTSPVTPFVGGAAGGAFGRKKADQFAIQTGNYSMVNVGGGLVVVVQEAALAARRRAPLRDLQRQPHPTNPGVLRCTRVYF